MEKNIFLKKIK